MIELHGFANWSVEFGKVLEIFVKEFVQTLGN